MYIGSTAVIGSGQLGTTDLGKGILEGWNEITQGFDNGWDAFMNDIEKSWEEVIGNIENEWNDFIDEKQSGWNEFVDDNGWIDSYYLEKWSAKVDQTFNDWSEIFTELTDNLLVIGVKNLIV